MSGALSLRQQAQMLEGIGEAVIATDTAGRIIYANRRAEDLYGWPRSEMIGRSVHEVTVPAASAPAAQAVLEQLHAGRTWSGEYEVRRRDGSTFLAQVTDSPMFDDAGRLAGVIGVSMDITPQKQAQLRLERHVRLLRMLRLCSEAIGAAESEPELLQEICRIVLSTGRYACVQAARRRGDAPGLAVQAEARAAGPAPDSAWSTLLAVPQGPAELAITSRAAAVVQDAQAREHPAALVTAARMAGVGSIAALPLGWRDSVEGVLVLHAADTGIFTAEKLQFLEELAHDVSLAIGNLRARDERRRIRTALEVIAPGVAGRTGMTFHQALAAGLVEALGAHSGLIAKRLPDGRFRTLSATTALGPLPELEFALDERLQAAVEWIGPAHPLRAALSCPFLDAADVHAVAVVPLVGKDSAVIGISIVAFPEGNLQAEPATAVLRMFAARAAAELERDEADARIREQAALLERLNGELEQRVRQRTAELEAANNELKAFSYSVSHDLRAPLAAVAGFAGALEEWCGKQLDDRGRDALARIQAGTHRMEALIQGLLVLARFSQDDMRWESVDLSALAAEVMHELALVSPRAGVQVHIQEGLMARGDARLLRQVLANLLGNAWKFTSRQADARIAFASRLGPAGQVVYEVRDNGPGFDMDRVGRLFGPFQRLHRAEEFPGTGVGLAIARRIVERHGGVIEAFAGPEGTRFSFSLGEA